MFDKHTMRIIPSASVVRVHLFRHGEVAGSRVCRGQSDARLSPRGEAQSAAAAEWLHCTHPAPDVIVSSDLSRCTHLARHLTPAPILAPALREQDMGRWDGRGWEDLTIEDPAGTTAYWDDYVNARPPGGESYGECFARVTAWWDAQDFGQERLGERRVVLVTHIGVIRALACHWLGMPPDQALRWAPAYASHSRFLLADAGAVVESFGETAFLPP
ncbi:MAG: histidine phosphatase family protein [Pseudomonadota bacterium]|nr:histidine phosphatase family protein [Pseudomonadota bacterium]